MRMKVKIFNWQGESKLLTANVHLFNSGKHVKQLEATLTRGRSCACCRPSPCQSLCCCQVFVFWCCHRLHTYIVPVAPPGGSGGTSSRSDCDAYNTVGLQWCCSSSLTLLAPPTGPPTTKPRYSASWAPPPPPCSRQATYGWPMRRWRPWRPLLRRSVPLPRLPFNPECVRCWCRTRGGQTVADLKACVLSLTLSPSSGMHLSNICRLIFPTFVFSS